jgi:hypothetical protein
MGIFPEKVEDLRLKKVSQVILRQYRVMLA